MRTNILNSLYAMVESGVSNTCIHLAKEDSCRLRHYSAFYTTLLLIRVSERADKMYVWYCVFSGFIFSIKK